MTDFDSSLSPSETFTDRVVQALDAVPPTEWGTVADRLVREHPTRREEIYSTVELHRQLSAPSPAAPPRVLAPGSRLGAFTVVRYLDRGGMGEVYEADQAVLQRRVAVKVIRRGFVSPAARVKFVQEQQVLARLHQSNIVPVHFAGEDGDLQYCVMHLVDGLPVHKLIDAVRRRATGGRQSVREAVAAPPAGPPDAAPPPPPAALGERYFAEVAELIAQVADAAQHGHEEGICHRDIKPSNLIVDRAGKCWVLDFGLAGVVRRDPDPSTPPPVASAPPSGVDTWLTTLGGTPQYMPPEQFRGTSDPRSDVYSIGLVLYELLALRPAYERGNWKDVQQRVASAPPPDPRAVVPDVPADLAAIYEKATKKEPAERYQTAAELAADLRRWGRGEPTVARPRGPLARLWMWARRNPAWASAIGGVVAAVLATAAALVFGAKAQAAEARRDADQELAAREKADEEKRQAQRERDRAEFQKGLIEAQRMLLNVPYRTAWASDVRTQLHTALKIRPGEDLRDTAIDTFVGLDLAESYRFDSTADRAVTGFGAVAFSPDGAKVVAGGSSVSGGSARAAVWDGNNGNKPVETTRRGHGPVAFPDADSPLTLLPPTAQEKGLVLWNVATNKVVIELPPSPGRVFASALSPDARFAVAVFVPPKKGDEPPKPVTLLWAIDRKLATAKKVAEWADAGPMWSFSTPALTFSPDGKLLATGTADGNVTVRTAADGAKVLDFKEGDLEVTGLGFGRNFRRPSGQWKEDVGPAAGWLLGVGSRGGNLSVWNLRTNSRVNSFRGSEHAVYGVTFSGDGTTLVTSGRFNPYFWDVAAGRPLLRVSHPLQGTFKTWTEGVALSPSGDRVAFGSGTIFGPGGLDVFRVEADRGVRTFRGLDGVAERVWLSPSGKFVAALTQNWQLGVWERDTGRVQYVWDVPDGWFADNAGLAFVDGDAAVLLSSGKRATKWSLTTGERTDTWELPNGLNDRLIDRPGKPPLLLRRDTPSSGVFQRVIRGRELEPGGKLTQVYKVDPEKVWKDWEITTVTPAGRGIVFTPPVGDKPLRFQVFDGPTGAEIPIKIDPRGFLTGAILSDHGKLLGVIERLGDVVRTQVVRVSDGARVAVHPGSLDGIDEAGKLGILGSDGVHLFRVGEDRPLVTFDLVRQLSGHSLGISPDGKFVYWGRRDGTVCVADVNQCLEQLAPFGKR